ncbi:MAG: SURF1 family protein [Myxococcota bacterium]
MGFRPGLVPTAFMIFGVGLTASLGVWQLNRHWGKQAELKEVERGLDLPVLQGDELAGDVSQLMYRKIEVTGRFVPPMSLTNGRKEFGTVGYGVVQPLQIEGGPLLLVDRGWVPRDGLEIALSRIDDSADSIRLQGPLRPVEGIDGQTVALQREGLPDLWPPGSWPALWDQLPAPKVDAVVLAGQPILVGEGKSREPLPVDGYYPFPKQRDSLSYAFQWWIFGTVLLGVWIAFGVKQGREADAR